MPPAETTDTADTPSTRRGDTWFRSHRDGRLLADLRWLGHQYQIVVFRLPERVPVAEDCCTEDARLARIRADRLVHEHFPHDCAGEGCAPWVRYTEA